MSNSTTHSKPWLTPRQQVEHLKGKGVRFSLFSEADAESYLARNNNFFRLRSYRTSFPKVDEGARAGEYANLDFGMLVDLSIIDMLLRYEMLPMTLDIEHFSKVKLLGRLEEFGEDGYAIVAGYLAKQNKSGHDSLEDNLTIREIKKGESSPYIASLLRKYPNYDYPVWVFLELVSFGTFVHFLKHCSEALSDKRMKNDFYLLQSVKSLRNACAHNNCILNDLSSGEPMYKVNNRVSQALGGIEGIGEDMRKSKMRNDRIQQVTTTLYLHSRVASSGVRSHRAKSLAAFKVRMNKNVDYYEGTFQVLSCFDFFGRVMDAWFSTDNDSVDLEGR